MFEVEYIIIGVVLLIAIYIIIETSVNSKKIKKGKDNKKAKIKTPDKKDETVEVKAVVSPTLEDVERQMHSFDISMEDVAKESIEDERNEKTAFAKEQARLQQLEQQKQKQEEQAQLEEKVEKLRQKLDQIELNTEEQSFVDELEELSPEMKAVLFADLLKRKGF